MYCNIIINYFIQESFRQFAYIIQIIKIKYLSRGVMFLLSITKSMCLHGLDGILIDVEVDISNGIPSWEIVGLPDASIKESKERVKTAIRNCGIEVASRKYVVNLSPANVRKDGAILDLAIAVGILKSMGIVDNNAIFEDTIFIGELSLNGDINRVNGILSI